jgi:dihydrofolate reductase
MTARRVWYSVAMSLDGYIACPEEGDYEWIPKDPSIDFAALWDRFGTVLLGRRTFEQLLRLGGQVKGMRTWVFSRTLDPAKYPDVTVLGNDGLTRLAALRDESGKDIWLMGGGVLFDSLLSAWKLRSYRCCCAEERRSCRPATPNQRSSSSSRPTARRWGW